MKVITSYFGNRILKHVESDMARLADEGFTGVVHTFSENDHRFYSGSFKDIVRVSHKAGLDVDLDPWGVGGVFGGEAFSAWISEHPDSMQVSPNGQVRPLACLNSKAFREYMMAWVKSAHESGADGLFWDEPHLYISKKDEEHQRAWTCACETCRKLFRDKFAMDMPEILSPEIHKFRSFTITDFLREMLMYGKSYGMRNTICLLPAEFTRDDSLVWDDVAGLKGIDVISTDPYWLLAKKDVHDFVSYYSLRIRRLSEIFGLEGQIWILGFRIPSGREGEIARAIETAYGAGIRNLAIWGFDACAQMSYLNCENPEKAWNIAVETFGKFSRKGALSG